ncbi:MAG: GTPase [Planctomycetota bacterium]
MSVGFRIATPQTRPAALAVIDLTGDDEASTDAALRSITGGSLALGTIGLRDLAAIDRGVVARVSPTRAMLMPHGGPAVLQGLRLALASLGLAEKPEATGFEAWPEASSALEAMMLDALARAPSPLAVDLLLSQPDAWRGAPDRAPDARDRRLGRLIDPPLVAAVGPPNVGKSSLLNALVGRRAAVVADEPGTTRDHVGAMVDLAGLVVRWIDTPGRRDAEGVEADAIRVSGPLIEAADAVVLIGDTASGDPRRVLPAGVSATLIVAGRSDLGVPPWPHDAAVSATAERGLSAFVSGLRDALVPPGDLSSPDPWVFWDSQASASYYGSAGGGPPVR